MTEAPPLSEDFDRALLFAVHLHQGQPRKGTEVPYVAHLLGVTSLVLEDGGSEEEAIAALLHDAPEDRGGEKTLAEIERLFGATVAQIVESCTDTMENPKPDWRLRKERYIAHLEEASPQARRVSLADKLYNARAILLDYRSLGDSLWERFNRGADQQLWYYTSVARAFCRLQPGPMAEELQRTVDQLAESMERTCQNNPA